LEKRDLWKWVKRLKVKIKKTHKDAVIPEYAKQGDAGLDLTAVDYSYDSSTETITYFTGLAVEIPEGHVGLLFPRSSIFKTPLMLSNSVGVIDSGYRGEVMLKFRVLDHDITTYTPGSRVGQLIIMPYPQIQFEEVEELSDSERGSGGYGSSGI
jgi:dUTP pyrophosphatase